MASRRTRIKGIANIPQRRKNNEENSGQQQQINPKEDKQELKLADSSANLTPPSENNIKQECGVTRRSFKKEEDGSDIEDERLSHYMNNGEIVPPESSVELTLNEISFGVENPEIQESKTSHAEPENCSVPQENIMKQSQECLEDSKTIVPIRRKFLKPNISANVIKRRSKVILEKENSSVINHVENKDQNIKRPIIIHEEIIISHKKEEIPIKAAEGEEVILNEFNLFSSTGNLASTDATKKSPETSEIDKSAKRILPQLQTSQSSDTEYPAPPPSPSKINRSRIKAIPRLSQRKTSFSASESEDENKRYYNRIRNDSVCSAASGIQESIPDCASPLRPQKEFSTVIQKKCNRTEQSRKLAEARREFHRRFGTKNPDKQKLKMIDLIFYNPVTNPMSEKKLITETVQNEDDPKEAGETLPEKLEPKEQPPVDVDVTNNSDEENVGPVPQMKIGPNGEIILDEQSLVIENKEIKKQKEEIQKSQLVNGDFDTGYGIYKRVKRAKDWTQQETLRLYKALNLIGTDFSLMCEIFPRRTRREIKMKFKKEERIHQHLIDRAIMDPCDFEFSDLKHEADREEKELAEIERLKEERRKEERLKKEEKAEATRKRKIAEESIIVENKPPKIRKTKLKRKKPLALYTEVEDRDADVSDNMESQSDSDEVTMPLKPTRSGRIPKVIQKYDEAEPVMPVNLIATKRDALLKQEKKENDVEPGSVIILWEKDSTGNPCYKIYMVTPDKNLTPLDVDSEVISKAIKFKQGTAADQVVPENVKNEDNVEVNVTIPAEENVNNLKEICAISKDPPVSIPGKDAYGAVLHAQQNKLGEENLVED